jgi:hypothetical protein
MHAVLPGPSSYYCHASILRQGFIGVVLVFCLLLYAQQSLLCVQMLLPVHQGWVICVPAAVVVAGFSSCCCGFNSVSPHDGHVIGTRSAHGGHIIGTSPAHDGHMMGT